MFVIAANAKRGSLKNYVYQQIIEMICSGRFKAGEIITEGQVIELLEVSKSPVREALVQLCYEDVLRSIPRCGYQIVHISAKNIKDLAELRLYLELSSLQKVSESLTPQTIERLKELTRPPADGRVKDMWTAWHDNLGFHLALTECAGNGQVTRALERSLSTCTLAYAQVYHTQPSAVVVQNGENYHQKIVRALENHEIYSAHELLKADIVIMEHQLLHQDPPE